MVRSNRIVVTCVLAWSLVLHAHSVSNAEALIQQERLTEAETVLTALAKQSPSDAQVRFRLGYVQFRLRKLDMARRQFAAVLDSVPPAYEARYFLGRIALLQEQPADAIRWLEPVVQAQDKTYDAASQLALAYVKAGQPQSALRPLEEAIRREPWDGGLYYRLGRLHQEFRRPELAREALNMAARLKEASRGNVEGLMVAGGYFRAGKLREAVERLQQVADRPEVEPNILLAAALLYTEMQQPTAALELFERAARLAETQFAAQFNFGLALLRAGRTTEAIPVLERAAALLPQSSEGQITLGLAAVMARRYAEAVPALERAHEMEPNHPRVTSLLATAYLRTEQAAKAAALLQPLIASASDAAPAVLYIEALQRTGREEQALAVAQETQQRFPEDLAANMTLAQLLTSAGRYAEARPVFAAVIARPAPPPEAMLGMADTLQKAGEHAAASEHYRKALAYTAVTLPARLGLARSLVALRQLEDARKVLEDGRRDHENEPALHVELARLYTRLQQPELAAQATRRVEELKAKTNP